MTLLFDAAQLFDAARLVDAAPRSGITAGRCGTGAGASAANALILFN
jgi:hypothetical protein